MGDVKIKYVIIDKEGQESTPFEHYTELVPRKGDTFKEGKETYIVDELIHEGLFSDPGMHSLTIVLKEV